MDSQFTTFQDFRKRYPIQVTPETLLGSGTYGKVVRVEDQLETEWVAVKISEFKGDDARSLRAEVELAKRIQRNVNIARYDACYRLQTDMGLSDFAVMKYYPDGNLADLLKQTTLTKTQTEDLVRGILNGLKHLHEHRIVHRDFKPANILISRDNRGRFIPKIADFGLSKLVNEDEIDSSDFDLSDGRGTASYKAPEQIEGGRVSFNLDLWAFGVILFEIMTGKKPFSVDLRGSSEQVVKREIEKKIISVALPPQLEQIADPYRAMIKRCLVKDIHERVRKEDELLDLLDGIPALFAEADLLLETKAFTEAIAAYESILQQREGNPRALRGIETVRRRMEEARIDALFEQAETDAEAGRYEAAIGLYEQVVSQVTAHPTATERLNTARQALAKQQKLEQLLTRADALLTRKKYKDAQALFAQILAQDSTHAPARTGLMACMEALKPVVTPVLPTDEPTDTFIPDAEPEQTDLFVPVELPKSSSSTSTRPSVVWPRWALPGVAGILLLAGGVWYMKEWRSRPDLPDQTQPVSPSPAQAGPQPERGSDAIEKPTGKKTVAVVASSPAEIRNEAAQKQNRHNKALAQARKAIRKQNWPVATRLVRAALAELPDSREAQQLAKTVLLASQQHGKETETSQTKAQADYDNLIEQGNQAANTNNKSLAISLFLKAEGMVKANKLSRANAQPIYQKLMEKGNRLFELGESEGAKDRFRMAQAIRNTTEVQQKINQCDANQ